MQLLEMGVPMVVYAAVIARDALTLLLSDMGLAEQLSVRELEGAVNRIEAALPVVK